jgi:hypothetical protein
MYGRQRDGEDPGPEMRWYVPTWCFGGEWKWSGSSCGIVWRLVVCYVMT